MSYLNSTLGGHNDQVQISKVKCKAGVAITKGQWVSVENAEEDGYTVIVNTATLIPCGVALEAAADGDYFWVQTAGIGLVDITTDGTAAANLPLVGGAAGACAAGALDATSITELTGAIALAADASTTLAAGKYMVTPFVRLV